MNNRYKELEHRHKVYKCIGSFALDNDKQLASLRKLYRISNVDDTALVMDAAKDLKSLIEKVAAIQAKYPPLSKAETKEKGLIDVEIMLKSGNKCTGLDAKDAYGNVGKLD